MKVKKNKNHIITDLKRVQKETDQLINKKVSDTDDQYELRKEGFTKAKALLEEIISTIKNRSPAYQIHVWRDYVQIKVSYTKTSDEYRNEYGQNSILREFQESFIAWHYFFNTEKKELGCNFIRQKSWADHRVSIFQRVFYFIFGEPSPSVNYTRFSSAIELADDFCKKIKELEVRYLKLFNA